MFAVKRLFGLLLVLVSGMYSASVWSAENGYRFGVDVKLQPTTWEIDNKGGTEKQSAQAGQFGFGLQGQINRFYAGISFFGGEFRFNQPPAKPTDDGLISANSKKINRAELDLIAGYNVWSNISLFIDIKSVSNDWVGENYKLQYGGLGLGVNGHYNLSSRWSLYGTFGVVSLNVQINGDNSGDGSATAIELGTGYKLTERINLALGIKGQEFDLNFNSGLKQTQNVGGLMLRANYVL
jgi:hypothetical protein